MAENYYFPSIFFGLLLLVLHHGHSMEPNWSVCSTYFLENCVNGLASDDCTFSHINPTGASVRGLWVFYSSGWSGGPETPGLAEFLFQERVGDYQRFTEIAGNISCLKRMGGEDHRTAAVTLVKELELIHDSTVRYFESAGSPDNCGVTYPSGTKSLAIHGTERWELFASNGTSVCIQVENTTSFIPGIVRDIRTLGLEHGEGNICAVVRGCSKSPEEVIKIPNNETSGVLRR
ncbi:hypothetical protein Ocin01_07632 [Orchesella cincta]|uniref:Uncharacterized protein n=1 Tax=Orchesella cincta TaxID=48709 RepID=A0A1D2N1D8_ORCCI|nr:hypothetical protein Ocin01_07632 [Orchesella cincta]